MPPNDKMMAECIFIYFFIFELIQNYNLSYVQQIKTLVNI